ncbi:MAG TPA: D-2-hydroxyacid dehydrogenase [Candidatus Eisenbacteria bacterium]|nr:D-2-hydroxyacid dehydrogenase [Candidatus Eisenbacteria bacterium]
MKIVVLDGFTLNPGDLSWDELKSLGECEIHDRSTPEEVVPRSLRAEIVITNKVVLNREQINRLPELKYIGVTATGYNIVDVVAARERNIPVTNVPAYGTKSVAQMTFALLLELTQHVGHHAQTVREGRWTRSLDFCYSDYPLIELDGLTMGVVGFGRIGRAVADLSLAFGLNVLAHSRTRPPVGVQASACPASPTTLNRELQQDTRAPLPPPVAFVDRETLFRQSDVISLHCPLTPETKHLINAQRLAWMKPTAFLLNTSRGPLIDEPVLAEALNAGRIAGAGLDVLAIEPPLADNPLLKAKNCLITPHISWATRAARSRLMNAAVANVKAFLSGTLQNAVN